MTPYQKIWSESRNRLVDAVTALGFPGELGELMARELKIPKAIDRMCAYVQSVRPRTEEMLVDEMFAICSEIDAWREKKASQEAQTYYNTLLFTGELGREEEETEN